MGFRTFLKIHSFLYQHFILLNLRIKPSCLYWRRKLAEVNSQMNKGQFNTCLKKAVVFQTWNYMCLKKLIQTIFIVSTCLVAAGKANRKGCVVHSTVLKNNSLVSTFADPKWHVFSFHWKIHCLDHSFMWGKHYYNRYHWLFNEWINQPIGLIGSRASQRSD
jgi:hypothetical protein